MDCPVEDAAPALAKDPNFGYFTAACTQQCRCTTQAKSDAYRVHGALSNAKYELTSSILKDDVIPYDSLTSHPIVPPPNVSNGEIANNPDRFCGFEACDSNADCSAFGVCGSCSIKTYIPGVDNLVYLWAVCEIAHNTTTGDAPIWEPGGNSTLGLEGFDSSTGAIGGLPRRRVKRATDYGCACNATYTRPECCGIPDGQLAANNLPSLGIVQPFADGQRFTPATAEA
ncbi:MAG: hypothetical protein M1828_005363 [Chrysothrix sp. TS-e1954]|nr:MAG: hypothetical protein M1828_005363 [Chrysothrix sp. TS-e1954]